MVVLATSEFIAAVRGFADRLASERLTPDARNVLTGSLLSRVRIVVAATLTQQSNEVRS